MDDIFHAPKHPYTRALLRSIPSLMARPASRLPAIAGASAASVQSAAGCPFHPRCDEVIPERLRATRSRSCSRSAADSGELCFLHHDLAEPA